MNTKKKEKEDGARNLPQPQRVLDDTDTVLAVGKGRA